MFQDVPSVYSSLFHPKPCVAMVEQQRCRCNPIWSAKTQESKDPWTCGTAWNCQHQWCGGGSVVSSTSQPAQLFAISCHFHPFPSLKIRVTRLRQFMLWEPWAQHCTWPTRPTHTGSSMIFIPCQSAHCPRDMQPSMWCYTTSTRYDSIWPLLGGSLKQRCNYISREYEAHQSFNTCYYYMLL